MAKCLPHRERNEVYKTKSIGFKGEALSSIAKSSELTITSSDECSGFEATYKENGDVKEMYQLQDVFEQVTKIKVRNVH